MKEFLITLFFGVLGIHKFMQKKYGWGALYLCTLGLFGIGWLVDTFRAFIRMLNGKQHTSETRKLNTFSNEDEAPANNLRKNNSQASNGTKVFTKSQLGEMKKADILELAAGLGYIMTTIESDTKDRIVADFIAQQEKQPSTDKRKWLIKTFNTEIVGTFAKCSLDKSYERADIVCSLKPSSNLYLEYWEYKGEPAYYVCCQGLDAGCVPATISKTLHDVYGDCELEVVLRGEARLIRGDWMQKIRIEVHK